MVALGLSTTLGYISDIALNILDISVSKLLSLPERTLRRLNLVRTFVHRKYNERSSTRDIQCTTKFSQRRPLEPLQAYENTRDYQGCASS
jgi:hypothetical protein